jgi:2',3'-cyclic-nucleotide 2'-phosphodiesterase (5'-nucleotidase family)
MPVFRRLAVLLALATIALAGAAHAATARITFILVNDIYLMGDQMMPDGQRRGGFARLAAVVKTERAKGGHVVLAHAGDTLSPSLMSGIDHGAHIIALTNMVAPDIFVPGNHEFDFGKATFLQRMDEAQFPLFAANMRGPDGRPLAKFKDRLLIEVDGVRIGLTGATYDGSARVSSPQDLTFAPTVATMQEQAERLRREGADFIVAVVHAPREQDYKIFATRAVDLLLSGHDHDLFIEFDGRNAMVESSHDAHYVTAIDVAIDVKEASAGRSVHWWPQFRIIDTATVTPDPHVAAVVARYEEALSRALDVPIGTTAVELDSRVATVRAREAAIGNLIADAMRASGRADAAVMNGGGIRGGKIYAPGTTITRRDILAELPFGNRMVTMEVTGAGLKRALDNGLSTWPNPGGRFPQVSGLTIVADGSRPPGARIVSITVDGAPLDETRIYRIATNDFLANGGDGYVSFRDGREQLPSEDSPLLANEVIDHVKRVGTVDSRAGGRIIFK